MKTYKMPNLGKFNKVYNMTTSGGNEAPNQFILRFEKGVMFQSYDSIIAINKGGQIYLGQNWNYSRTTWKYRNDFLRENTAETRKSLEKWEYKLLNI